MKSERFNVFGVAMDAVNLSTAIASTLAATKSGTSEYVCLTGAHGIVEARRDPLLAKAFRNAVLMLPDGMPTVWIAWWKGLYHVDRVFGPDLMLGVIDQSQTSGERHFLLGGNPGVVEELVNCLQARFPAACIVGTYTPPFRRLNSDEEAELATLLEECRPDIVWVGIGTPKQELFMSEYVGRLKIPVMVGVGAAFDFHTRRLKDSPQWVKRAGLQWFHRLMQDPKRLWWRYLRTNTLFLAHAAMALFRLRNYPTLTGDPTAPTEEPASSVAETFIAD
jgi:N-acetylglucosaminyldiphosphoundecaprenol N-acetyl-beta-D-mannosaminyltransferase